ncbi:MAG: hypothetical protein KDA41_20745 [Planctomycetales bacterium]|nr:hypothetical protein [Planctomycetales bacterium]
MHWLGILRSWLTGPDLAAAAEQIAIRNRTAVWQRIQHRAGELGLAEARGYVRVKASQLVRAAVDRELDVHGSTHEAQRSQLEQLAMEAVLRLAVMDTMNAQRTEGAKRYLQTRRAA